MKVLVVRFSSIGDIILTTPVIRCLSQQLGAEVHFICKKTYGALLEANPYLHTIHTFENHLDEVLPTLRELRFNYLIDLHHNLRSWRLKMALKIPSYSFEKLNLEKWLLVNLKYNRLPDLHIVDRYLKTVAPLGVSNDGVGLDYFCPKDAKLQLPATPYIAFAIGAAHATKRLPNEQIIRLCQRLTYPIRLLGGPGDKDNGMQIAKTAGPHVQNDCGQLSLHQSAAVIQASRLVISHDTGMMHIAAAFHKPIISIWGNTVPAFGMYPYYGNHVNQNTTMEVTPLACRPCSKIGSAKCPRGHFRCMWEINLDSIAETAERIWQASSSGKGSATV